MRWSFRRGQPACPAGDFVTGDWIARFETRSIEDIRALGRNSPADDRAFAAVARLSEVNLSIYRTFMQPLVRALASQPAADLATALNPLRLSYTMFADRNPWMGGLQELASGVTAHRQKVAADNPFLALQTRVSDQIVASLEAFGTARDRLAEQMFFGFYGSPIVQALLGINDSSEVRTLPATSLENVAARQGRTDAIGAALQTGGFDQAMIRAVLYVVGADQMIDQRCAGMFNAVRQHFVQLPLAEFKALVRDQLLILQREGEHAIEVLVSLVPDVGMRKELLTQVKGIVGTGDPATTVERVRFARLANWLEVPYDERSAPEDSAISPPTLPKMVA